MPLEELVQEIVVPDIHNNWQIYQRLGMIIDPDTKRVFFVGDLRNRIDFEKIKSLVPPNMAALYVNFEAAQKKLARIIEKFGSPDQFVVAMQGGQLSEAEKAVVQKYNAGVKALEGIEAAVFQKESGIDYAKHEELAKKIKEKHKHVELHGVPGNHDTIFIKDHVPSIDWLVYSQSLQEKGIVGAFVCREEVGETNPMFNGPNLKYVPIVDDDYNDISQSQLYQEWHDVPINLMVTHSGGNWGTAHQDRRSKYKTGLGITKLGEEKGFVCYEGHIHEGLIYRDPKTKVLVIRPGTKHVAKVWRQGNEVKKIQMYRVPAGKHSHDDSLAA
ncbi:MAG TPA: hypothetical protein VI612_00965 [Candidatus Nanoarchaeia archaeon]|nr:hypothetical protein [Candidatus Nanoarchaeia archaeon]